MRAQLDKELAKFPGLTLVAFEMFGGKYNPAKLRFPDNLIASLPASPLHKSAGQRRAELDGDPRLGERPGGKASACFVIKRSRNEKRN